MINIPKDYYLKIENNEISADHGPKIARNFGSFGKWVFKVLKRLGFFSEYSLTKIRKIAESQSVAEAESLKNIKKIDSSTMTQSLSKRERKIQAIFSYIIPKNVPSPRTQDQDSHDVQDKKTIPQRPVIEELDVPSSSGLPSPADLPLPFEPSEIFYLTETSTLEGIKEILKKLPTQIRHLDIQTAGDVDDYIDLIPLTITSLVLYGVKSLYSLEKLPRGLKALEVSMNSPFCWQKEDYMDLPDLTSLTIVFREFFDRDASISIPIGYFDHLPKSLKHFAIAKSGTNSAPTCYLARSLVFPEGLESLRIEGFVINDRTIDSENGNYTIKTDMFPSTLKKLSLPLSGYYFGRRNGPLHSEFVIGSRGWPQGLTELYIIEGGGGASLASILRDLPPTLIHLSVLGTHINELKKLSEELAFPPHLKTLCLDITPDVILKDPLSDSFVFKNLPDSLEALTLSAGKVNDLKRQYGWFTLLHRDKRDVFSRNESEPPLRIQLMINKELSEDTKRSLNWNLLKQWGITPNSFIVDRTYEYQCKSSLVQKTLERDPNFIFFEPRLQSCIPESPAQEPVATQEQKQESLTSPLEAAPLFVVPAEYMLKENLLRKWDTVGLARMMQSGTKGKYYQHYLAMQAELLGRKDHGQSLQQIADAFIPEVNHFLLDNIPQHQIIYFNIQPNSKSEKQDALLLSIVNSVIGQGEKGMALLKRFDSTSLLTILISLDGNLSSKVYNRILAELLTRKDAIVPPKIVEEKFCEAAPYFEITKTIYLHYYYEPQTIQKFLSALLPEVSSLAIPVNGNVDEIIDNIPTSITSLSLYLQQSDFNTEKLPRELRKLEIKTDKFEWTKEQFENLPPQLDSLRIEAKEYPRKIPNYYFESLPLPLKHLEIIRTLLMTNLGKISNFLDNDCIFPKGLETLQLKGNIIFGKLVEDYVDYTIKTTMFPSSLKKLVLPIGEFSSIKGNDWPNGLVDLSLSFVDINKPVIAEFMGSLPHTITNLSILGTGLNALQTKDFIYPPLLRTLTMDITKEVDYDYNTCLPPNEHSKTFCLNNLPKGLDTLTVALAKNTTTNNLEKLIRSQKGWFALFKRPKNEVFLRDKDSAPLRIKFMVDGQLPKNMPWKLMKTWDLSQDSFVQMSE